MPVVGHGFIGIITAQHFEPGGRWNPQPVRPTARALWTPALVGLAYLPDVATQIGRWVAYESAQLAGHSLFFGLLAGVIIGRGWALWSGGSVRALSALAIGSIMLHDLLDLLQATDRAPLWPFATRLIVSGWLALPDRLSGELLVFGLPYAFYEGGRFYLQRGCGQDGPPRPLSRLLSIERGLVILLLASAVTVQQLRAERQRQATFAERLLRSGQFADALKAANAADRWPSTARPGRIDVVRGEAHEGLGNHTRAETLFLRAYRTDPHNFWAVAALAEYYASHGTSTERRRRSAPFVDDLRRRFSDHDAYRAVMDRVEIDAARVP